MLTPQDHQHFLEHGYVVVKNVLPPETIAAALAVLEAGAHSGQVGGADYQGVRGDAVNACITDTIHEAIADLFGPDYPFVRARQADDMPRVYQPDSGWPPPRAHIDDDYPTLMPNGWAVGLFVFLTPVQSHGGAFVLFSGSYRRYQELISADPDAIVQLVSAPENAGEPQEFLADPGDILLFHHLMGHAGSNNVSDPSTRHALLSRWHPTKRIVPGDTPTAALSTIEKVNSLRARQELWGTRFQAPVCETGDDAMAVLREGWASSGSILAQALVHVGGKTHLFFTDEAQPHVIQHVHSTNLLQWETDRSLPPLKSSVQSLSLFRRGSEIRLLTGTPAGAQILSGLDLHEWTTTGLMAGSQAAAGHFSTGFGSKTAHGQVLFFVPSDSPGQVRCRWANTWKELENPTQPHENEAVENESLTAEAPSHFSINGFCLKPVFGESLFGLIADLVGPNEAHSSPFYTLSSDSAAYPEPFEPLAFTASATPHGLQVYSRARHYWLVTYLREQAGTARLFWGVIDWETQPPVLREITTAAEWRQAFDTVGLR